MRSLSPPNCVQAGGVLRCTPPTIRNPDGTTEPLTKPGAECTITLVAKRVIGVRAVDYYEWPRWVAVRTLSPGLVNLLPLGLAMVVWRSAARRRVKLAIVAAGLLGALRFAVPLAGYLAQGDHVEFSHRDGAWFTEPQPWIVFTSLGLWLTTLAAMVLTVIVMAFRRTGAPGAEGETATGMPPAEVSSPASFALRVGGFLLDVIVVGPVCVVVVAGPPFWPDLPLRGDILLLLLAYGFLASATGGTIGMRAVGIRIVPDDGRERLSAGRAFLRALVWVPGWPTLGLVYLWMLWDGEGRTLHDRVSHSRALARSSRAAKRPEFVDPSDPVTGSDGGAEQPGSRG